MPDINSVPTKSSPEYQHLHHLFEDAMIYLKQSPLTHSNLCRGIDTLLHLLDQVSLVDLPVLHAMTHTATAVKRTVRPRQQLQIET